MGGEGGGWEAREGGREGREGGREGGRGGRGGGGGREGGEEGRVHQCLHDQLICVPMIRSLLRSDLSGFTRQSSKYNNG